MTKKQSLETNPQNPKAQKPTHKTPKAQRPTNKISKADQKPTEHKIPKSSETKPTHKSPKAHQKPTEHKFTKSSETKPTHKIPKAPQKPTEHQSPKSSEETTKLSLAKKQTNKQAWMCFSVLPARAPFHRIWKEEEHRYSQWSRFS